MELPESFLVKRIRTKLGFRKDNLVIEGEAVGRKMTSSDGEILMTHVEDLSQEWHKIEGIRKTIGKTNRIPQEHLTESGLGLALS